jgi:myo-inositol-1(or 4)-monophosphatase
MPPDLDRMRAAARRASLIGGQAVRSGRRPATGDAKGLPGDWVTDVDVASERAIASFLGLATPEIPIHGEELGGVDEGLRWVVDPLDGTTNFLHGFWAVGVSVALVDEQTVLAGAVHAPFQGDVWHGAHGAGATWERPQGDPAPCRVSDRSPEQAVVATGFPFRRKERLPRYLVVLERALLAFEDIRRAGAASLDLAWVACGVFEGFFELGLAAWDVAAGGLLVREAGGLVTDWAGTPDFLAGNILAGSPAIHAVLARVGAGSEPAPKDPEGSRP